MAAIALPAGYTKRYADPWSTSFDYVDANGNVMGKGYDSYQDAIRKLAFSTGLQEYTTQAGRTEADPIYGITNEFGTENWSYNDPFMKALPGGFGWFGNYTPASSGMGTEALPSPEDRGQTYGTALELWEALNSDPLMLDKLSYDSKEKYGRALTEGQLQNMYARYASGNLKGAVPDWEYHREAYNSPGIGAGYSNAEQPAGGYSITGEQALIGSIPVFGADGKITGYKINMNPEHIRGADTSGRVRSSSNGATMFDPSLAQYITDAGDGYGYLDASNVDKFGYRSAGQSTYSKEENLFDKYMPGLIQSAALGGILTGAGQALGFSDLLSSATKSLVDAIGLTGDAAKALTTGINSAVSSVPKTILTGGDFSDVLTNAATSGVTSGASSLVGNTVAGAINGVPTGATDDQYTSVETASQTDRFPLTGTVAGAAAGATGGIINAGLTGGDVGTGALTGLIGGGAAGGVGVDLGAGQAVGNTVGNIAGGLVNQALQPDPVAPPAAPVTTPTATPPATETDTRTHDYALNWGDSPSFASLIIPADRPEWGTRLNNGRPA